MTVRFKKKKKKKARSYWSQGNDIFQIDYICAWNVKHSWNCCKKATTKNNTHTFTTESELQNYDIKIYVLIMCALTQSCNTLQMHVYNINKSRRVSAKWSIISYDINSKCHNIVEDYI